MKYKAYIYYVPYGVAGFYLILAIFFFIRFRNLKAQEEDEDSA